MAVTVELHAVHAYPPALLNRDDQGTPKEAHVGGVRRVRVSSQSQKLRMRRHLRSAGLIPAENLAERTRTVVDRLAEVLIELELPEEQAAVLAVNAVWGMGILNTDPANALARSTSVLLFISADEVRRIAVGIHERAEELLGAALAPEQVWPTGPEAAKSSRRDRKAACPKVFQLLGKAWLKGLDGSRAVDLALFGRMLAEEPTAAVDGAMSVAHAFGVDEMITDLDYFTAVDDRDARGSGYLDTGYLSTPLLYRYAAIDLGLLRRNLAGDEELAAAALGAAVASFIDAQPAAKRTSTAPFTRPAAVIGVVRTGLPLSLADAFIRPVARTRETDLLTASVARLAGHWQRVTEAYGDGGLVRAWHVTTVARDALGTQTLPGERVSAEVLKNRVTAIGLERAEAS